MKPFNKISKFGSILLYPVIVIGGVLMVFESELRNIEFTPYLRWIVLLGSIIVVVSGIIDLFKSKK